MSKMKFKFTDAQLINAPDKSDLIAWKDSFADPNSFSKALRVTIEATHAAMVNRNIRWYSPTKMNEGAPTFINGNKPAKVLKHHDSMSDPVGVVRGSRFVPTVPEDLKDNPDVITLMSDSADMKDQIKAMKRLMKSGITSRPDWRGLGYIELVADILDKNAIEQISDGRFDAVSTSFRSPGHAYCFICGQNWGQDGPCDHDSIGDSYEDDNNDSWPMMLVPGLHLYDEVSLVVKDADPITAIQISDSEDKNTLVEYGDGWQDNQSVFGCTFEFKDSIEEDFNMAKTNDVTLTEEEQKMVDTVKSLRPEISEEDALVLAKRVLEAKTEKGYHPDQKDSGLSDDEVIANLLDFWDSKDEEINADEIYSEMEKEMESVEDAKLSTEERKKLSKSTFCGPGRSFPVPDCAHVTAAKRLIGRYKGPGDKTSILACVNRKAKALGCNGDSCSVETTPEVSTAEETKFVCPTCDNLKELNDTEVKDLYWMLQSELSGRKLVVTNECADCIEKDAQIATLNTEITEIKESTKDSADNLKYLRAELRNQASDYTALADELIQVQAELHQVKVEKVSVYGVLSGAYKTVGEASDALNNCANLETEFAVFNDKVDFEKISKKISDGMSNNPTGTVIDPTLKIESDNELIIDNLPAPAKAAINNIKDYLANGLDSKAKALYDKMVSLKVLDKTIIDFERFTTKD